jgi:hypothetical protein
MTSGATSRMMSRATSRGTRTRGGGEVVDDEPARGGVADDERRDEPRDELWQVMQDAVIDSETELHVVE